MLQNCNIAIYTHHKRVFETRLSVSDILRLVTTTMALRRGRTPNKPSQVIAGVVDIVVPTAVAFHGFAVERRANVGGALFTALVAILLIIFAVVWYMVQLWCGASQHGGYSIRFEECASGAVVSMEELICCLLSTMLLTHG